MPVAPANTSPGDNYQSNEIEDTKTAANDTSGSRKGPMPTKGEVTRIDRDDDVFRVDLTFGASDDAAGTEQVGSGLIRGNFTEEGVQIVDREWPNSGHFEVTTFADIEPGSIGTGDGTINPRTEQALIGAYQSLIDKDPATLSPKDVISREFMLGKLEPLMSEEIKGPTDEASTPPKTDWKDGKSYEGEITHIDRDEDHLKVHVQYEDVSGQGADSVRTVIGNDSIHFFNNYSGSSQRDEGVTPGNYLEGPVGPSDEKFESINFADIEPGSVGSSDSGLNPASERAMIGTYRSLKDADPSVLSEKDKASRELMLGKLEPLMSEELKNPLLTGSMLEVMSRESAGVGMPPGYSGIQPAGEAPADPINQTDS